MLRYIDRATTVLGVVFLSGLPAGSAAPTADAADRPPNVLVILADDVGRAATWRR